MLGKLQPYNHFGIETKLAKSCELHSTTLTQGDFFEMADGRIFCFHGAMSDETTLVLICSVADRLVEVTPNACLVKVRESAELFKAPRQVLLCGAWAESGARPGCTYVCSVRPK